MGWIRFLSFPTAGPCHLEAARIIPLDGSTRPRPWSSFPTLRASTAKAPGMWITSPPSNQMRLRGRGFTLAEALIASVVLAVAVVGIMGPLSATYQQSRNQDESRIAVSLGRQLLEEIVSKPFVDPSDFSTTLGPEADESGRSAFDNVVDYTG